MTIDIEVPGPNVSCVMMDDIKAFDELTQYLIDNGHRKIVVVHGRKLAMVSMQPVSYTHLDVYKRQLYDLRPERD